MNLNEKYYVIQKMVRLIDYEKTGTTTEFSRKLGISRSQLFIELENIKSLNVELSYRRSLRSYTFSGKKKVIVRTPITVVEKEDLNSINGGNNDAGKALRFFFQLHL